MSAEEIDLLQQSIKEMSDVEKAFARGDFENVLFRDPTLGKMLTTRCLAQVLVARHKKTSKIAELLAYKGFAVNRCRIRRFRDAPKAVTKITRNKNNKHHG